MKQVTALKLTCVGAFVAALGVGCASSGTASYDVDSSDKDMSASASANTGTETTTIIRSESDGKVETSTLVEAKDRDVTVVNADPEIHVEQNAVIVDTDTDDGEARATVSALGSSPETRATWVNRFPFSASSPQLRSIETYTFAVPADVDVDADAPEFSADLPPGTVFVEAAGGAGEVRSWSSDPTHPKSNALSRPKIFLPCASCGYDRSFCFVPSGLSAISFRC